MDAAPPRPAESEASHSQSLERGLSILAMFRPERALLGVSDLARELGSAARRPIATSPRWRRSATSSRTRRRGSTAWGRASSTSGSRRSTRWSCGRWRRRTSSSSATRCCTRSTWRCWTAPTSSTSSAAAARARASARSTSTSTWAPGCRRTARRWGRCCSRSCRRTSAPRPLDRIEFSQRGPNTHIGKDALLEDLARIRVPGTGLTTRNASRLRPINRPRRGRPGGSGGGSPPSPPTHGGSVQIRQPLRALRPAPPDQTRAARPPPLTPPPPEGTS